MPFQSHCFAWSPLMKQIGCDKLQMHFVNLGNGTSEQFDHSNRSPGWFLSYSAEPVYKSCANRIRWIKLVFGWIVPANLDLAVMLLAWSVHSGYKVTLHVKHMRIMLCKHGISITLILKLCTQSFTGNTASTSAKLKHLHSNKSLSIQSIKISSKNLWNGLA